VSRNRGLRAELGTFDFTLLVLGAVIGADVYVVAALGASALGPAQLVGWFAAGLLAGLIALTFVQCAAIDSDVGGSYSYARTAFGPFVGFIAGWALYVGEWVALPVFPLAFVNYFGVLVPDLSPPVVILIKVALIGSITSVNLLGVRQGARLNDVLTLAKLLPLSILIVLGILLAIFHPAEVSHHLKPFAPLGWGGFGHAILPIFWAYAGFELAVLPASEVREPKSTLPRGLILGMTIATVFYLLTAFAVVGALPWQDAAASSSPLADTLTSILDAFGVSTNLGADFMALGALVSIAGVYTAFTLGVARLSYALSADGLFPAAFARIQPKFETPHVGLAFQASTALAGSILFDVRGLITIAVFFLGISYTITALAALRLVRQHPDRALRIPGLKAGLALAALSGVYLTSQASLVQIGIGLAVMVVGICFFAMRQFHWPWLLAELRMGEQEAKRFAEQEYRWLLRSVRRLLSRIQRPA
jgi:APA family basic amino acid/polyamine antiporter